MKAFTEKILHYIVLFVVTALALTVMWRLSAKSQLAQETQEPDLRPLATVALPKAPVAVEPLQVEMCEITSTFAGKIQPWETYQIGFEVAGRVLSLGENAAGKPLDEGDRVEEGQILAMLDDRALRALRSEAAARMEQAKSDLQRAEQVRRSNPSAVSDSELQSLVTDLAMARAQYDIAAKSLEDATLHSPATGTISQRLINPGEMVGTNQVAFEVIENDEVLLVVDVPESQIRTLRLRKRIVEKNREISTSDPEGRVFRAYVQLEGKDTFGKSWPKIEGEVFRVPEVADDRTSLFPVEIRLPNEDRLLQPGMVATADVVSDRIPGYAIPEAAVLFRAGDAHVFTLEKERAEMELLYWDIGSAILHRARRIDLQNWVDQGSHVVVPAEEVDLNSVVVRGHYRLADGQLTRIVNTESVPQHNIGGRTNPSRIDVAVERKIP